MNGNIKTAVSGYLIAVFIYDQVRNLMRKRLFEIVEHSSENDKVSKVYDIFMMVIIFISLIPLAFKKDYNILLIIDKVAAGIFIVDYIIRWFTADMKLKKGNYHLCYIHFL